MRYLGRIIERMIFLVLLLLFFELLVPGTKSVTLGGIKLIWSFFSGFINTPTFIIRMILLLVLPILMYGGFNLTRKEEYKIRYIAELIVVAVCIIALLGGKYI